MRNYAKVGGRKGMPGYRTPSRFRYQASLRAKTTLQGRPISPGDNLKKKPKFPDSSSTSL